MRSQQKIMHIVKSKEELIEDMNAILQGDWHKRDELIKYFRPEKKISSFNEEKNQQEAFCLNYFKKQAKENGYALAVLGFMYSRGIGPYLNLEIAFDYYWESKELDNPWGLTSFGLYYAKGKIVEKNEERARQFYLKAANKDYPLAHYLLYLLDRKNKLAGFEEWLLKAASHNYPPALKDLYIPQWKFDNPFDIYIPQNKKLAIKISPSPQSNKEIFLYKVSIKYQGRAQVHDRKLLDGEINLDLDDLRKDNQVKNEALKIARPSLIKILSWCCIPFWPFTLPFIYLDSSKRPSNAGKPRSSLKRGVDIDQCIEKLAKEKLSNLAQEILANYIKQADQELTRRLQQAQNPIAETKQVDFSNLPGIPTASEAPQQSQIPLQISQLIESTNSNPMPAQCYAVQSRVHPHTLFQPRTNNRSGNIIQPQGVKLYCI